MSHLRDPDTENVGLSATISRAGAAEFLPTAAGGVPARMMAMVSSTDFLSASERATAIATLNGQRHLTPSCGGFTPTAERTVGPARTIVEELDTQTRN